MIVVDVYNFVWFASDESLIQTKQNITLIFIYFCSSLASVFLLNKIDIKINHQCFPAYFLAKASRALFCASVGGLSRLGRR